MTASRILLISVALFAAMGGLASYLFLAAPKADTVAQTEPVNFELVDTNGQLRQYKEWEGQIVLINFWAPWCAPCRAEIPLLIDLQNRFAAQGLQILGPALDKPDAVQRFAEEYGINYPLFAELEPVLSLQEAFGDTRLPYTVLLDQQGRIAFTHAGELEATTIEAQIKRLTEVEADQ